MKRMKHARMLVEATNSVDLVQVTSPLPQNCLRPAYENIAAVYRESHYASSMDKREIRLSGLAVRSVLSAIENNRRFSSDDVTFLRKASKTLRAIASHIIPKGTAIELSSEDKTLNLKLRSLAELSDAKPFVVLSPRRAEIAASPQEVDLRSYSDQRSKLPTRVRNGERFVIVRMPIVAYPLSFLSNSALERIGLTHVRIADAGARAEPGRKRNPGDTQDALVFENQVVVGLRPDEASVEDASRVASLVSDRIGEHVNPLTNRLLVSAGSELRWMWLVPARAVSNGLRVRDASFPWQSRETKEVRESDIMAAQRELKSLEDQQAVLLKRHGSLGDADLRRMPELRELIDRKSKIKSPEEQRLRLQQVKAEFETEFTHQNSKLATELDELQKSLRAIGSAKKGEPASVTDSRKKVLRDIGRLQAASAKLREALLAKYRNKMR